jgi:hypothetical protein
LSSSNWRMEKRKRKKKTEKSVNSWLYYGTVGWPFLSPLFFFFYFKTAAVDSVFFLSFPLLLLREREKVKTDKLIVPFFLWVWIFYFYFLFV